ncbi:hypothetical protein [Halomonas sp. SpR8]|uniref:phosphorylase family protein n=1 Tax=Halomonas sp. SpR8 TaxID=3050463 RepID=UPI0027E470B9|nr:hypothetical protein [Halomonas sp. SpR8]MDQ7727916.1 hypothetical protein [Halomonas sp. SpR8]
MNSKILIVDDTYQKTQVIANIVSDIQGCEIECCNSAKSAIIKMRQDFYDLLIVDLQIPSDIGEPIDPKGGVELISYCSDNVSLKKPTHIIGITSHKESYDQCKVFFEDAGWPLLLAVGDRIKIKSIIETKIKHVVPKPFKVDVAIITALHKIELQAILALDIDWREETFPNDSNSYYFGEIDKGEGGTLTILATSCSRMGMSSAAATTMKVCEKFSPDMVFMTGIAAGVEGKTNFGDILVADPCWDWGSGKSTIVNGAAKLLSAPHQIQLDPILRAKFQKLSVSRKYLDDISSAWPYEQRPTTPLNLLVGPLATGAVVLENPDTVSEIVSQHRETIGVEMEAYGFCYAASISSKNIKHVVVKSVCDFANTSKNDNWQKYAAFTSAKLVHSFLLHEL